MVVYLDGMASTEILGLPSAVMLISGVVVGRVEYPRRGFQTSRPPSTDAKSRSSAEIISSS